MKIAGGTYLELCEVPAWNQIFGSGGRAAVAVSALSPGSELHTYCRPDRVAALQGAINPHKVRLIPTPSTEAVAFAYFHPLSTPHIEPSLARIVQEAPIIVAGDVVLRFGFLEGDAIVDADRAVYDPQTGISPAPFRANGSKANRLAVVLNEGELRSMAGVDDLDGAAATIMAREGAVVVVAKGGAKGAMIYEVDCPPTRVPAYLSERVFKIGSGDVFSAVFAHYWGEAQLPAVEAADLASRSVAFYCAARVLPVPLSSGLTNMIPAPQGEPGAVYLAAACGTLGQRWIMEEARWCLRGLGVEVVGAQTDGISAEHCAAVAALVDGANADLFLQITKARSRSVPVVALAEAQTQDVLGELRRQGCEVTDDFATAMYRAVWAAAREMPSAEEDPA